MSLVVKTGTSLPAGDMMLIEEKVARDTPLCIGSEIFVWTAETQGGAGLVARGEIEAIGAAGEERRRAITILLQVRRPSRPLGTADLARYDQRATGDTSDSVESRLAAKLYGHSLNRVVQLQPDEANFLRQFL